MGDVPLSKECAKCRQVKPASEFHRCSKNRDGLKCRCKVCRAVDAKESRDPAYFRAYYQAHREEIKVSARRYYVENTEHVKERVAEYYREVYSDQAKENARRWNERNPEKVKKAHRKNYEAHREEKAAYGREYYRVHAAEHYRRVVEWHKHNPERANDHTRARRARKRSNGGSFTVDEWLDLCAAFDFRCACCGVLEQTVDHVIPVTKGGSSDIANIQPLCKPCNSAKGTKETDYREEVQSWVS